MKNALRLLSIAALGAVFAFPAYAQDAAATPAAGPCTTEAEAKAATYQKFLKDYKGSPDQQKAAYESGKDYLGKYGTCPDEADKKVAAFIQNWVGKYEKAVVEFNCTKAANENPAEAFSACRPLVAANPDNPKFRLALVGAGIKSNASGSKALNAQAAAEARAALQMIESGKTTETWAPFTSQQDAAAGLRYYIAAWTYDTSPEAAAAELLKVAQSNSLFAKEPATFQLLGAAYYNGELKKLADEYKVKYEGKEETPESAALFARVNQVLDRVIDSYARAVALANANPSKYGATATQLKPVLTTLYKQRHEGQETGLNELIAGVLSKPLPIPGQEPAPTVAPASTNGTNGTNGTTPATPTQPASTTTTPPAAKPAATPQKPPRS